MLKGIHISHTGGFRFQDHNDSLSYTWYMLTDAFIKFIILTIPFLGICFNKYCSCIEFVFISFVISFGWQVLSPSLLLICFLDHFLCLDSLGYYIFFRCSGKRFAGCWLFVWVIGLFLLWYLPKRVVIIFKVCSFAEIWNKDSFFF